MNREQNGALSSRDAIDILNRKIAPSYDRQREILDKSIILGKDLRMSIDRKESGRNQNIFVTGMSSKEREELLVIPNILQMNTSFVVDDPDCHVSATTRESLMDGGYDVVEIGFPGECGSYGYDPFKYLYNKNPEERAEKMAAVIASCIMTKTPDTWPVGVNRDAMYKAAELYLKYEIAMMATYVETSSRTMNGLSYMAYFELKEPAGSYNSMEAKYTDNGKLPVPLGLTYYKKFLEYPAEIKNRALEAICQFEGIVPSFDEEFEDFTDLRRKKTAVFINIPAVSRAGECVSTILHLHILEDLFEYADNSDDEKHEHIQFYFDWSTISRLNRAFPRGSRANFANMCSMMPHANFSFMTSKVNVLNPHFYDKEENDPAVIIGNCDTVINADPFEDTKDYIVTVRGFEPVHEAPYNYILHPAYVPG